MRLTEVEMDCIRGSFDGFSRAAEDGGDLFYGRLFELAPDLRALFPGDIREQGVKLMSMLATIVAQLHDYAQLRPLLKDLARRHVAYGALPQQYELIGEALIWTLAKALGPRFDPVVRDAWIRAYRALAYAMIEAATDDRLVEGDQRVERDPGKPAGGA